MVIDAIVVGGGPAGLSAASWLARYRRDVVLLDDRTYRNRWVRRAHGYLGWGDLDPRELLERGREDYLRYPNARLEPAKAVAARGRRGRFAVVLEDGREVEARRVVLATGVSDAFPDVEGFFDHYGTSVFHCPTCDGYEAKGLRVAVFGWAPHVGGFAEHLAHWAASVTVVTEGRRFEGNGETRARMRRSGIEVLEDDAVALLGEPGRLSGVRLASGHRIPCELAFFSIAHRPNADLADALGCERTSEGYVRVDHEGQTTVEGVYAAGDLTPGMQLLQVAAAKGTIAGVSCAISLPGVPD